MVRKNKEKWFWRLWHGLSPAEAPSHFDRLNYRLEDLEDEDLFWLTRRVETIGQLDLDETFVTNEGIKYLTHLKSLTELRLKGLDEIDDVCIPYLNQITSLETLHLGGTSITAKGALGLDQLTRLRLLLLPAQSEESQPHLDQLAKLLTGCEIIVNYQRYFPDNISPGEEHQD